MVKTNPSRIILKIKELERQGELNHQNVLLINNELETNGYDFRILLIQHGYPYFSCYFEIINVADFSVSKYRSKNTFQVYDKRERILLVALEDIILTLKNINGNPRKTLLAWRVAMVLIGQSLFSSKAKADQTTSASPQTVIEQLNKNRVSNFKTVVSDSGSGSGSSIIPGASALPPRSNYWRHPMKPRMRGLKPDGITDLGNLPKQFYRPTTDISSTQRDDPQCPAKKYKVENQMSSKLAKISKNIRKDRKTSKSLDELAEKLGNGQFNAGRNARKLGGSESIFYMRAGNQARLYFRYSPDQKGVIEIIGEANKDRQQEVIDNLQSNYK